MIWWNMYLIALFCSFQLLAISIALGNSTFCTQSLLYESLSILAHGWQEDFPIAPWSPRFLPQYQVLFLGFENLRVKRNELCFPLAWRPNQIKETPLSGLSPRINQTTLFPCDGNSLMKSQKSLSCFVGLDSLVASAGVAFPRSKNKE